MSRLYRILKTIPNYVYNLRPIRNYARRTYQISGYLRYLEMDLAFMHPFGVTSLTLHC